MLKNEIEVTSKIPDLLILDPKKDLVTQDPDGVYIFPFLDLLQKIRFHVPAKHQPDVLNSSWHFTDQEKKHNRVASEYQAIFNSYQILSALSQELKNASLTMKAYLIEMYDQAGEWELVDEKVAAFEVDRSHLYQVIEITNLLIGDLVLQFTIAQNNFSYNYRHISTDTSGNNATSARDFDRDGYGLSLRKKLNQLQSLAEKVVTEVLPDVVAQIQPDAFVSIDELALELDEFSTAILDVSSDEELP